MPLFHLLSSCCSSNDFKGFVLLVSDGREMVESFLLVYFAAEMRCIIFLLVFYQGRK